MKPLILLSFLFSFNSFACLCAGNDSLANLTGPPITLVVEVTNTSLSDDKRWGITKFIESFYKPFERSYYRAKILKGLNITKLNLKFLMVEGTDDFHHHNCSNRLYLEDFIGEKLRIDLLRNYRIEGDTIIVRLSNDSCDAQNFLSSSYSKMSDDPLKPIEY